MKIAIDLLWVKHQKVGGIESYVRNLLDGFLTLSDDFLFILLVSRDNRDSFLEYSKDKRIVIQECPVVSTKLLPTVIWENLKLDRVVTKLKVDFCFVPYYRCPVLLVKNKYVIVVHDLNALHFPDYFSKPKYYWMKYYWKYSFSNSKKIIAISNFVKEDIIHSYNVEENKISVIYNPISKKLPVIDFNNVAEKYLINKMDYIYIVSSMFKHKNLITILRAIKEIKELERFSPKLVISGISGSGQGELYDYIKDNKLENVCVFTGYISNEERNTLMKYSKVFLFPSLFEGFGMPPIEASRLGAPVITTKCPAIPEVTKGKLIYVNNPLDEKEWAHKIIHIEEYVNVKENYRCYDPEIIAAQYLEILKKECE